MPIKSLLLLGLLIPFAAQAGPEIQHWQTGNGADVYFVPAPELPMVDVQMIFDAGSARDQDGQNGLALLTNILLEDGAKTADGETLSTDEIAERFADLGARFGSEIGRDMASISLRSLTDPDVLQPALETAALLLESPTFPEEALERERNRMLIGLQSQQQSPAAIASLAFYRAVYGDHPYAVQPLGTVESVNTLSREDVVDYHARYYVANNATVAMVGALDRKQAEALAETLVGGLPAGKIPPVLPKVEEPESPALVTIDHPSAQSHVLVGQPGISRDDSDYFPLLVGNHILGGGGLVSRLFEEVREQRGLSYSAYSYFQPMQRKGPYTLGLQTQNEQTDEALQVLRDTLQEFVNEGPTTEELEDAKQNITGGFALRIDSNASLLGYLAVIGFYDLPLDYLDTYNMQVEQVTLESIQDAFQKRISPENMATVVVGDDVQIAQTAQD